MVLDRVLELEAEEEKGEGWGGRRGVTPVVPSHICPHPGGGGLLEGVNCFPNSISPLPPMGGVCLKSPVIFHFCLLFKHKKI